MSKTRQPIGKGTVLVHKTHNGHIVGIGFGPQDRLKMYETLDRWHQDEVISDTERLLFRHVVYAETWEPYEGIVKGFGMGGAFGVSVVLWGAIIFAVRAIV